jgi:hypothetical protein
MTPARAEQDVGQLPAELAAVVRRVTKATRLRRAERADVMAELTSHFEEALASGRSAAQAMDEFGDPKAAARGLRAAAIAKRSALDRALGEMLRWTGWAVAATVLAYAGFVAYLSLQAPAITMDALAALAERTAKPATPDDDAWPVYRRAFLDLGMGVDPKERDAAAEEAVDQCPWPGMWKGLPPDPWPLAAAWVDGHATAITTLRAATMRPVFGFPVGRGLDDADVPLFGQEAVDASRTIAKDAAERAGGLRGCLLGVRLPHLRMVRAAARILVVDAIRAAEAGDAERATSDLEAIVRMSLHCQDSRVLICDLVAIAIRSMAVSYGTGLLEWKPGLLSEAQLRRVQAAFDGVPPALQRPDFGTERLMTADMMQRLWTDDGAGNGWFRIDGTVLDGLVPKIVVASRPGGAPAGAVGNGWHEEGIDPGVLVAFSTSARPVAAFLVADRKDSHEFADRWFREWEQQADRTVADHEEFERLEAAFGEEVRSGGSRWMVMKLLMPSLGRSQMAFAMDRARCRAIATACAAERFRRVRGRSPTSAEAMVPDFLAAVPRDDWSGAPIRMAGDGASFRIWSVGQNRRDDGGRVEFGPDDFEFGVPRNPTGWPWNGDVQPKDPVDWVWYAPTGSPQRWAEGHAR